MESSNRITVVLPVQILSSVVGFLGSPQDLVSCILTSQQLQAAVRSGRVSLELTGRPRQLLSFPSQSGQLDDLMQALIRYMPGEEPTLLHSSAASIKAVRHQSHVWHSHKCCVEHVVFARHKHPRSVSMWTQLGSTLH